MYWYTVEPLNKGHVGTRSFVLYREVSFIQRLKCTGMQWNLRIKDTLGQGVLSFIERFPLFRG